jgi:hypothetical protein
MRDTTLLNGNDKARTVIRDEKLVVERPVAKQDLIAGFWQFQAKPQEAAFSWA